MSLGQRVHNARIAAGLTLQELGDALGVTKAAIKKYESGQSTPDSSRLLAIAQACGVRTEYFFRRHEVKLCAVEFRKNQSFGKKRTEAVKLRVAAMAEKWVELLESFPASPVSLFEMPALMPESIDDPAALEGIAEDLRHHWELGLNPIADITSTLEDLGVLVVTVEEPHRGFSGMVAEAVTSAGQTYPVISVSSTWPGDRQRFTLLHEFSHWLLGGRLADTLDIEKACDRLAGAMLAPRTAVVHELGDRRTQLDPHELQRLKIEYGLSMRGLAVRALQCDVLSPSRFQTLMKLFSAQGWNREEPGDPLPVERPQRFEQLVYRALAEGLIREEKAAALLDIPRMEFSRQRWIEAPGAAVNQ